jgi:hypothetical protein
VDGPPPAQQAPDLFRALELEPIVGQPRPADAPRPAGAVEDELEDETTTPVQVGEVSVELDMDADSVDDDAPTGEIERPRAQAGGGSLADLLEPDAAPERRPIKIEMEDSGPSPVAEPEPATPRVAPAPSPEEVTLDDQPSRRGAAPWILIVLVLMLGGALAWVVLTQTDLQFGDVVAKREADAKAEVEAEQKAVNEAAKAAEKEYGTIAVNTEPDGAQVFMFKPGPNAKFENLPRAHEYLLLIEAQGQLPQIRRIKGTEIGGKLTVDLDPNPNPDVEPPIPDEAPPRVADQPNLEDVAILEIESPDDNARFGLLVGYTPGVRLVDLEAEETHELLVYKPGYRPHTIVVKGRHWEETGDGLVYSETVSLEEAPLLPEGETEGDLELGDEEGTGGPEAAGTDTEGAVEEPPPPSKPKKKKKKRKKKKKKKR